MIEVNFAQMVGLLGFAIGVTGFFHKNDRNLRLQMALFGWIMTVHFLMLGAVTAAIGTGVSGTRSYISTKTQSVKVMGVFIALLWILAIPNISGPLQVIPLIGTTVATYGFFKTSGIKFRLLILFNTCCWLINNYLVGSIGGLMSETTFFIVNSSIIFRMWNSTKTREQMVCK